MIDGSGHVKRKLTLLREGERASGRKGKREKESEGARERGKGGNMKGVDWVR
jgi:hypothetical protein